METQATAQGAPQDTAQTTATPAPQDTTGQTPQVGQTPVQGEPNVFMNLIDNFAQNFAPQPQAGQNQSESDWMRSVLQQQQGAGQQQPQAPQAPQQAEMFAALQAQMAQNTQVQQMAATLQTIAAGQQQAQLRADIDALKGKYASFDERAIQNKLGELAKANPAAAIAFDNKQGWEILHLAYFANTQPKADPIVSGAQGGSAAAPSADLVKSLELGDNSNLEQIGKLF